MAKKDLEKKAKKLGIELTGEETVAELETLIADKEASSEGSSEAVPEATATEKKANAEKIAAGETPGGLPSKAAIAADAKSKETGENTDGVLSPDPKVGEKVPSDFVPPGAEVNPKTGAVIPEGTTNANSATPRPNLPASAPSKKAPAGKEWAGNHTV